MRRFVVILTLILLSNTPLHGQTLQQNCLSATTVGDATIYCNKAALLLQRQQLKLMTEIRNAILRTAESNIVWSKNNTEALIKKLTELEKAQRDSSSGPQNVLFVKDLTNISGNVFTCNDEENCQEQAQLKSTELCQKFGYGSQHAHEYGFQSEGNDSRTIKWIICRP